MDQALLNLMEAAEGGLAVPQIYVWTGGLVVTGQPISADECWQCMTDGLLAFKPEEKVNMWNGKHTPVPAEVEAEFEQILSSLGEPFPDPGILNLGSANVFTPANGETVSVAAVRVSVSMISAWFTGDFTSKEAGSSFFVGGFLPLNL